MKIVYDPVVSEPVVSPKTLIDGLDAFMAGLRRLDGPTGQEEATQKTKSDVLGWATAWKDRLEKIADLRNANGVQLVELVRKEANGKSNALLADLLEGFLKPTEEMLKQAKAEPVVAQLDKAIKNALPVFIYFEDYGTLDSAIYLPRFLEDLEKKPDDPKVRTINAMFKHVQLTAKEIAELGKDNIAQAKVAGQPVTQSMIAQDQENKELRAIKLNSASLDISRRFSDWWKQRRHKLRYHVDGDHFRIWVSDDRRPDVEIELESRSKGFQWFFSFYLIFLVESDEGHKHAVLLLDEPALHLHPTAQQEMITFFEALSEKNQLAYSTHSPFLIDGDHLHRIRPVTEDETGHSHVSVGFWPKDRETIFPLQAAAAYAMMKGLFKYKKNVILEGLSDYYYLTALKLQCHAAGREGLSEDIHLHPVGGTKNVSVLASLFLGEDVRALVILDSDDEGKKRESALLQHLYSGEEQGILMLGKVYGQEDYEIEDLIGEGILLPVVNDICGKKLVLKTGKALVDRIEEAAKADGADLPDSWKIDAATRIVVQWSTTKPADFPKDLLDRASNLFNEIAGRFKIMNQPPGSSSKS